jgi:hypothetical protein
LLFGLAEVGVEKILVVPFHAGNGRFDNGDLARAKGLSGLSDAIDGELSCGLGADDAALSDVFAARFKLRLNKHDSLSLPGGV